MRVDTLINPKAGYSNQPWLEKKLRETLFRCDLHFHSPRSGGEIKDTLKKIMKEGCQYLIVCGGDGTINKTISPLLELQAEGANNIPALCVVPSGTANDFAANLGLSKKVEKSAKAILDGGIKIVDILQVIGDKKVKYMVTNGGMGVPAQTALNANIVRRWIKGKAKTCQNPIEKKIFQVAKQIVEIVGSKIYDLILINDFINWGSDNWNVRISIPGKTDFDTQAPFILVNNQPSIGGSFRPAPFTVNTDGTFNILMVQPAKLLSQTKTLLDIRRGRIPQVGQCVSFEAERVTFHIADDKKLLTFFGDGELLHKNVKEIEVRCIHPGLPVVILESET